MDTTKRLKNKLYRPKAPLQGTGIIVPASIPSFLHGPCCPRHSKELSEQEPVPILFCLLLYTVDLSTLRFQSVWHLPAKPLHYCFQFEAAKLKTLCWLTRLVQTQNCFW